MAKENLTQSELGDQWLEKHSEDTIYSRNTWYRYGGGVWGEMHRAHINREVWGVLKRNQKRHLCRPSTALRDGVTGYIKDQLFIPDEMLDQHPSYINLTNGVYHIDRQSLIDHDPSYYLTTQLPFSYDPGAECPMWEHWVRTSLVYPDDVQEHDPQLALFVQEAVGYSLTASTRHQVSFWCVGGGANGKSVLFHVLESLGGTSAMPFDANALSRNRYQIADLAGKRIALCPEANSWNNVVADADLKELIGGGSLLVRQIRERSFILHPIAKFWWAMNRVPVIADTSLGFWRRVRFIPFNRTFAPSERILDLTHRLDRELPGIFNWAMVGLARLMSAGAFTPCAQVAHTTEGYRQEANLVEGFVQDHCEKESSVNTSSSALYRAYRTWAERGGYKPVSAKSFKREIEALGHSHRHTASGNVYTGLRLR